MTDDTNINDDDMSTEPTEAEDDRDTGGGGSSDTGDEPTEAEDDRDTGAGSNADTGDEA